VPDVSGKVPVARCGVVVGMAKATGEGDRAIGQIKGRTEAKMTSWWNEDRARGMWTKRRLGVSVSSLAREHGISAGRVYQITNGYNRFVRRIGPGVYDAWLRRSLGLGGMYFSSMKEPVVWPEVNAKHAMMTGAYIQDLRGAGYGNQAIIDHIYGYGH
jgi:hypothetical protein